MKNKQAKYKTDLLKRCYKLSLKIISLCDTLPKKNSAWIITDQLIRAATSIGANIIEARSSSSRREFKRFFEIALKSANETKYWLSLLKDSKLCQDKDITPHLKEVTEIAKMLASSIIKLKK